MNYPRALQRALRAAANPSKAAVLRSFFKTGKGDYAEGDQFLGVTVPVQRKIAAAHESLAFPALHALLRSKTHEERLTALLILVRRFQKADTTARHHIFTFYLEHLKAVNNWDLVDLSADKIVGPSVEAMHPVMLDMMARSDHLWTRRIAIVATFHFIRQGKPENTLRIAHMLLHDKHDLIHKAVGWMLREVGKRCGTATLEQFLDEHAARMPRTMLRYAIERLPEPKRAAYLRKRS